MMTKSSGRTGVHKGDLAYYDRFGAIPGLLVTSGIAFTLLSLNVSDWRGSESLLDWTKRNRNVVTVIVQVISHILGLIMVQVVCALIRTSFVLSTSSRPFSLRMAQFIQAASTPRMTWSLPWSLSFPLMILVAASFIPGAMWAGALAPYTAERNTTQSFQIPTFDIMNSALLWNGDTNLNTTVDGAGKNWVTDLGLFSFEKASMRGPLQSSASDASFVTDGSRRHFKLDKTGYAYTNRSYGTGGIAGFVNFTGINAPDWYLYSEQGLGSTVKCFYNRSIDLHWQHAFVTPINVYQSYGTDADGGEVTYTNYMVYTQFSLFSWSISYTTTTNKIQLQIITGASSPSAEDDYDFHQFNNMQCDIAFQLQDFDVFVNSTSKIVNSTPKASTTRAWPSWGDTVANKVGNFLYGLTLGDGCVDGCTLGTSMLLNVNKLRAQREDHTNSTDILIEGVEDFVASIVDNSLVDLLLTRMVSNAPGATKQAFATIGVPAIVFGDRKFIVIVVVINILICAAYVVEFARTRAWRGIPSLDFMNLADMLISASKGGIAYENMAEQSGRKGLFDYETKMQLERGTSASDLPLLIPLLDEHSDSKRLLDTKYQQVPENVPGDNPFADDETYEMTRRQSRISDETERTPFAD